MTASDRAVSRGHDAAQHPPARDRLKFILVYLAILHALLFAYDLSHPGPFLNADRATTRLAAVTGVMEAFGDIEETARFLSDHGIIGDYLFHACAYALGGRLGVIFIQVVLTLLSAACLYRALILLNRSHTFAATATLIYAHLPHTLIFPHQLITEGLVSPLLVISFYWVARSVSEAGGAQRPVGAGIGRGGVRRMVGAGLLAGLASVIRPVVALWAVLIGVLILLFGRRRRLAPAVAVSFTALAPLLVWMALMWGMTGEFTVGRSGYDLQANLGKRIAAMLRHVPETRRAEIVSRYLEDGESPRSGSTQRSEGWESQRATIAQYFAFVGDYPAIFLRHLGRDVAVYVSKSGVNRIVLDYFEVAKEKTEQLQDPRTGWRSVWERSGAVAALRHLAAEYPRLLAVTVIGIVGFGLFMVLVAIGAIRALRRLVLRLGSLEERFLWSVILMTPLYVLAVSQTTINVSSRNRAPAEFALTVLAVLGLSWLARGVRRRRVRAERVRAERVHAEEDADQS